ncbi:MAG: protoheme IX farnesyltransferase [Planctomycetes bacterium]|nr:protoheme IX farnesyltransferase [Planctomycetota bacterium]
MKLPGEGADAPRSEAVGLRSALADLATLTKPRIGTFVWYAGLVGGALAQPGAVDWWRCAEAGLWILLLGAGASAFNQVLERDTDRRMERTAQRPLPAGRVRVRDALLFGAALAGAGTLGLALRFNVLAALLGLATLVGYALVYTPMKRVSSLNTVIGALPGAMPPLVGYAALAGSVEGWAYWLFGLLFVWQFPHFMAIAWLWRHDYARAGLRMLPSTPEGERQAGRQALVHGLLLLPIAILPALHGQAGGLFAAVALALSMVYAGTAAAFAWRQTSVRARVLLYTSLAYLPVVFALPLIRPLVDCYPFF